MDLLLIEVCEAMLGDDKRGLLAASSNLTITLLGGLVGRSHIYTYSHTHTHTHTITHPITPPLPPPTPPAGPFEDKDPSDQGDISFDDYTRVLRNLGATLTFAELRLVAMRYRSERATFEPLSNYAQSNSQSNYSQSNYSQSTVMDRHLVGGHRVNTQRDPQYHQWASTEPSLAGLHAQATGGDPTLLIGAFMSSRN